MKGVPLAMFWLLGLIWGSAFIYMKLAAEVISPVQIVMLRVLFGLLPVAIYAYAKGALRRAHFRHIGHFTVMAVVGTIGYYYGFAKGASILLSGVTGALSGLTPIISFILALLVLGEERFSMQRAIGVALGFLGVLMIARPMGADLAATNAEGVIYTLIGALSVGASFVYARRFVIPLGLPGAAVTTYQLAIGLVVLLVLADLDGISAILSAPYAAAGLILGLGVVGTGLAFILYYYIIDTMGAVTAASVAYIPPLVAILIGVLLAGEQLAPWDYAGAVAIMTGLLLVNRRANSA